MRCKPIKAEHKMMRRKRKEGNRDRGVEIRPADLAREGEGGMKLREQR